MSITLSIQLIRVLEPVIIILGVVGNSLNIAVLTRPNLLKHACSYYFIALAINNLFISVVTTTSDCLSNGYQIIDVSTTSLTACKLLHYVSSITTVLSSSFIILASIDRYFASSSDANRRKLSNIKVARWAILFITTLFGLIYINTIILSDIRIDDGLGCTVRLDTIYKQVYTFLQALFFAIISPCLMAIFGVMTIYNIKRLQIVPVGALRHRRTESQLAGMLLLQVGTYIILNLPVCFTYMMSLLSFTFVFTLEFTLISTIARILNSFSYTTHFFLYIFSASVYREELIRLLKRIRHPRPVRQIHATDMMMRPIP